MQLTNTIELDKHSIGATFAAASEVALLQSTLISQQSMASLASTHLDLMKATSDLPDGAAAEHAGCPAGCAVARASTS